MLAMGGDPPENGNFQKMKVGLSKPIIGKLFDAKLSHECRERKNIWKINSLFSLEGTNFLNM